MSGLSTTPDSCILSRRSADAAGGLLLLRSRVVIPWGRCEGSAQLWDIRRVGHYARASTHAARYGVSPIRCSNALKRGFERKGSNEGSTLIQSM
jgi:hypothetical protein